MQFWILLLISKLKLIRLLLLEKSSIELKLVSIMNNFYF